MLIGVAIIVALVVLIGALILHASFTYGQLKGYEQGLDDAEQIFKEVKNREVEQ